MKNHIILLEGPKNTWNQPGWRVTWFSTAFEVEFRKRSLVYLEVHLWLLGFQIFELNIVKKT